MKKITAFILVILLVFALCACETAAPTNSPIITVLPPTATTPAPTSEPTPAPKLSLTTGLPSDKEYKPITVMVENSVASRPQTGVMQADIIYEAMAEGSITRMMLVFNDQKPVVVGPVRSARIYFINIQKEWDSPFVHYGGPSNAGRPSYIYGSNTNYIKVRVDGIKGAYNNYFWRDSSRAAPHNAYTDLQKIEQKLYDYTPKSRDQFTFSANVSYTGQTIDTVGIPFLSGKPTNTQFKYDKSTGRLTRYVDGKVFEIRTVTVDASGKKTTKAEPMTVQNLIVQYAKTGIIPNDSSGRRMVDVVGKGNCEFYVGGVQLKGTWERASLNASTQYKLEDGTPVTLKPGNTWIVLQPTSGKTTVTFQ